MKKYLLMALALLVVSTSHADENDIKLRCEYDKNYFDNYPTQHKSLQNLAKALGPTLCKNVLQITDEEISSFENALTDYAVFANADIKNTFPEEIFTGVSNIAQLWEEQLRNYKATFDYLNPILFGMNDLGPGVGKDRFNFRVNLTPHSQNYLEMKIDREQKKSCKTSNKDIDCQNAIDSLNNAIKPAFSLLNSELLENNGKLLGQLQSDWKSFIKEARYQTPLDVWFTTVIQSDKFNGADLTGPPTTQWFLLRPSLVYEHVKELEKGNRDQVSVALEWVGMNWWKEGIGFSFTSIYNDRAETSAVGHGFTLHIKNKYSIGYVHRKDKNGGVFLNLDLLEVFGEKKKVYKKYKDYF
jgi:hypothetical protein